MKKIAMVLLVVVFIVLFAVDCLAQEVYYPLPTYYPYPYNYFNFISLSGHDWKQKFEVISPTWLDVELKGSPNLGNIGIFNLMGLKGQLFTPYSDQSGTPTGSVNGKITKLRYATFGMALSASPGTIVSGTVSGYGECKPNTYYPTLYYLDPSNHGTIGVWGYGDSASEFYQQSDYSNPQYYKYDHTNTTIAGLGCYLCCCCRALKLMGVYNASPPVVNAYLISQKDGYGKGGMVNPLAIVRYAKSQGISIGFKRNVPLDEALQRGLYTQVRVKSPSGRSHWVSVIHFIVNPSTGKVTHRMNDPMYSKRKWKILESYSEVYKNDTRCFYPKNDTEKTVIVLPEYIASNAPLSEKAGYIEAFSTDATSMTLYKDGAMVEEGYTDILGDALDVAPDISTTALVASSCLSGSYTLVLQGTPGASFSVDIGSYDDRVRGSTTIVTGTFDSEGKATIPINHRNTIFGDSVFSIKDMSDGQRVDMSNCLVTAIIPGEGFYIQPTTSAGRTPACFVSTLGPTYRSVINLSGTVGTKDGQKVIQIDSYTSTATGVAQKPVGVPPEKVGTTFHLFSRTYGKITEIGSGYLILNGTLRVNYFLGSVNLPVGTLVRADGVEHKGKFYATDAINIAKIN